MTDPINPRDYSVRELLAMVIERQRGLDEKIDNVASDFRIVHGRVDKTNGRVTTLEHWRTFLAGGFFVGSLVLGKVVIDNVRVSLRVDPAVAHVQARNAR